MYETQTNHTGFSNLGLIEQLVRSVAEEGYTEPTPIQTQSIPHVLAGRDLLGCAQTGTGKTAAFALPILQRLMASERTAPQQGGQAAGQAGRRAVGARSLRVLVLTPTRELATQIGDSFATYGRHTHLRHTVIFGGVGQDA